MVGRSGEARFRIFGAELPRRGLLRGLGSIATAVLFGRAATPAATATSQAGTSVTIPCVPCMCDDDGCGCCLIGFTGGGVVQLVAGEAQVVVFATRLEEGASQQGAGFVRWMVADSNGQDLMLESIGPITYERVTDQDKSRDIRGIMRANGEGEHAFHLRVTDYGPDKLGQDLAALSVGMETEAASAADAFSYQAEGTLIGGDFQLLDSVAPVNP